jgi:hypothetical protein
MHNIPRLPRFTTLQALKFTHSIPRRPFYNFQEPALFGFPFFYWYQLAFVPISSLLIWLVYRRLTPDDGSSGEGRPS